MKTNNFFKIFLLSIFCISLISCNDDDSPSTDNPSPDRYDSPYVPKGRITIVKNDVRQEPYLGAGYDIMGSYLDNTSVKGLVIDLTKLESDQIENLAFRQSCSKNYEGYNATDFLKSIMTKNNFNLTGENNNDLLFTGTLTGNEQRFPSPYDYSEQYTFICNQADYTELRQSITVFSGNMLARYLSDAFMENVKTLTPQQIIALYGTHVIRCAYLGNRIRNLYCSIVVSNKKERLSAASYGAEARRQEIYKTPNSQSEVPSDLVAKNYGGTTIMEFNGGDLQKLPPLTVNSNEVVGEPMDISAWRNSLNSSNYTLTTLSGDDLIPLYELVTDQAISNRLKEATVAYIKSGQLAVIKNHPLLQARKDNQYRYFKSFDDFNANAGDGYQPAGVIGSLFDEAQPGTSALYLYSNDKTDYLSFDSTLEQELQMKLKGTIGYCYTNPQSGSDILYEISDGNHYAYTLEDKAKYGDNGSWKKTGKGIYMEKVSL